jgi:LSD1 subclass zinc finger protein
MLLSCPTCRTTLRVPDGSTARVRCPTCNTVFAPASGQSAPPPPPAAPPVAPFAPPRPVPIPAPPRPDDAEDQDDRPRRRRADDDDDERPRGRRRGRDGDDDEDEEGDFDRRRRRRRRDEEDDDRPVRSAKAGFAPAKIGALLLAIGFWMNIGVNGTLTLFLVIGWAGGDLPTALLVLAGVLGLGNWLVSLVGLGFAIAGPSRARGLAIAATAVAAVHLILTFICFARVADGQSVSSGPRGDPSAVVTTSGFGDLAWLFMCTTLPAFDAFTLPVLVYASSFFGDVVLATLAGACELARLILIVLTLRSLAEAAKDFKTEAKARLGVLIL